MVRSTYVPTRVGICVPVHTEAPALRTTVLGIERARRRAASAGVLTQLVVVVDGGAVACSELGASYAERTVELPKRRGSYAARNAGIDALVPFADFVLFTDAGCIVDESWVIEHVEALRSAPLSGGAVEVPLPSRPTPAAFVDASRNLRQQAYVEQAGYAATCNLGVRADVLRDLRFDENLRSGGDRKFCHEAARLGYSIAYAANALVVHPPRLTRREVVTKARRVGHGVAQLPPWSAPAEVPAPRFGFGLARSHHASEGLVGRWWAVRVAAIDYLRARALARAVTG